MKTVTDGLTKLSITKILIYALLLRLLLAPLAEHGDVINYMWWSKDLLANGLKGFYERQIANAMPPTYPPITSYIFFITAYLHEYIWKIFWFLNLKIGIFPSNLVFWLESDKGWYFINKLPAIIADLGLVYLLYKFVSDIKNEISGKMAALFFAFLPPFWYSSSLWGQTDSIFALPLLAAFYAMYKDRKVLSTFLILLAILTKPTAGFVLPAYILWWIKKAKSRDYYWSLLVTFSSLILIYLPFHQENIVRWIFNFYKNSLGGELDYIVANAFNFWGLIYGFDDVSVKSILLGIPTNILGYLAFLIFFLFLALKFLRRKYIDIKYVIFISVILSYFAFLVLPMMHERYFYPTLLFMIPLATIDKSLIKIFLSTATLHFINLYHFWWVPRISPLISMFTNHYVEKSLIIINIAIFLWLLNIFKKQYAETTK